MSLGDLIFLYRLYTVQPFGYRRDEFNTGLLCSHIFNSQRAKRDSKVWSPYEFMPMTRVADDDGDYEASMERSLLAMQALARRVNRKCP